MAGRSQRRLGTHPQNLLGATDFSDDDIDYGPEWVVETFKEQKEWCDELCGRLAKQPDGYGAPPLPGEWPLAYLGFVVSQCVDVLPFWKASNRTNFWRLCGFKKRPAYSTVWKQFADLEENY